MMKTFTNIQLIVLLIGSCLASIDLSGQSLNQVSGPTTYCLPGQSRQYQFDDDDGRVTRCIWYINGSQAFTQNKPFPLVSLTFDGDGSIFVEGTDDNWNVFSSAGIDVVFKKAGSISSNNYVVCPGQSVALSRSGGIGNSFSWLARPASPSGQAWTTIGTGTGTTNLSMNYTVSQTMEFKVTMNDCGAAAPYYESGIITVYASNVTGGTITNSFNGSLICYYQDPGTISNGEFPYGGNMVYTYQWERNFGSGWTPILFTNSLNYSPGQLEGNVSYRRRVNTGCGDVNYSNVVSFNVRPTLNPQLNTTAFSQQICSGTTINLTSNPATGGDGVYNYTWLESTDFVNWAPAVNGLNAQVAPTTPGYHYYKRQVSSCGETKSTEHNVVQVSPQVQFGAVSGNAGFFEKGSGRVSVASFTVAFEWRQNTGSGWQSAPNQTGNMYYDYSDVTTTTQFQAYANNFVCPPGSSSIITVTIVGKPVIQIIGPPALAYGANLTTTLQTSSDYSSYSWFKSGTLISGANSNSIVVSEPGKYVVKVRPPSSSLEIESKEVNISTLGGQEGINVLSTTRFIVPGISPSTNLFAIPNTNFRQAVDYHDGFGRSVQSIAVGQGPARKDLIAANAFDDFGRPVAEYLPFAANAFTGLFRNNALNNGSYTGSDQYKFYTENTTNNKVARDTEPYSITVYDNTPLGRVLKQGAPGTAWQPDANLQSLADKTVKNRFLVNAASEVLLFTYNTTDGSVSATTGSVAAYYGPGQLAVSKTYDENNNEVITYTDKEGKLILKKVQYGKDAGNNPLYGSTYYVYNDYGNLVVVLPPEAINSMGILFTQN